MNPKIFLDAALEIVHKAEPLFLRNFGAASGVSKKADSSKSQVSDADTELEKLITGELVSRFPDHSIVAEEGASRDGSTYTWYVDPIDGTTNYIRGIRHCSISVALWDDHGPLVGIVSNPVNQVLFIATRGGGAHCNGKRIGVSKVSSLKDAVGNLGWDWSDHASQRELLERMRTYAYRWRMFSGSALELCFVAAGQLDFFINLSLHNWDFAAAALIVTEAGGRVTQKNGAPLTSLSSDIVATNGVLHDGLIFALK